MGLELRQRILSRDTGITLEYLAVAYVPIYKGSEPTVILGEVT